MQYISNLIKQTRYSKTSVYRPSVFRTSGIEQR